MSRASETRIIPVARIYTGVILISNNNEFILQRRDNKKSIVNPGLITPFGGSCKEGESTLDCAIREIYEELNYRLRPEKMVFLTHFVKQEHDGSYTFMYFYVYTEKVDVKALRLSEGAGIETIPLDLEVTGEKKFSIVCKKVMEEYKAARRKGI